MKVDRQAIQEDPALRRGLYSATELARYLSFDRDAKVKPHTVTHWARRALSAVEHRPRRPDYAFVDLVSMLVVRNLVELGLPLTEIRDSEDYLRSRYGHKHPFVSVHLRTDGADVFYEASPTVAEQLTAANRWGQEVLEPAISGALHGVTYYRGVAAAWSPMSGVVLDPRIQFGEPCVADTRLTTRQLAELIEASDADASELAATYRVEETDVRRALDFERRLAGAV